MSGAVVGAVVAGATISGSLGCACGISKAYDLLVSFVQGRCSNGTCIIHQREQQRSTHPRKEMTLHLAGNARARRGSIESFCYDPGLRWRCAHRRR